MASRHSGPTRSVPGQGLVKIVHVDTRLATNKLLQKPSTSDSQLAADGALTYPIRRPYRIDKPDGICANFFKITNVPRQLHVFTAPGVQVTKDDLARFGEFLVERRVVSRAK